MDGFGVGLLTGLGEDAYSCRQGCKYEAYEGWVLSMKVRLRCTMKIYYLRIIKDTLVVGTSKG